MKAQRCGDATWGLKSRPPKNLAWLAAGDVRRREPRGKGAGKTGVAGGAGTS